MECLPDNELLKATWLELKKDHPDKLKQKLLAFGVQEIQYPDKSHFYFQAPGGHVFHVAAA
ncbi:MAG: hypothetical protein LLG04_06950 [Parachlamydia sp.]|nr:hypothetical protein [Parachlamydia sp.]